MINKKAFLLGEETLKIIIAVICIGFLVYLLTALYFSTSSAQKTKEAAASLQDILAAEINRINSGGEINSQGIFIPNPAGWYVISFTGEEKKPNSCIGKNCICICSKVIFNVFDRQIKQCDDKGACSSVSNLASLESIKIGNSGTAVLIQKINDFIQITKI